MHHTCKKNLQNWIHLECVKELVTDGAPILPGYLSCSGSDHQLAMLMLTNAICKNNKDNNNKDWLDLRPNLLNHLYREFCGKRNEHLVHNHFGCHSYSLQCRLETLQATAPSSLETFVALCCTTKLTCWSPF